MCASTSASAMSSALSIRRLLSSASRPPRLPMLMIGAATAVSIRRLCLSSSARPRLKIGSGASNRSNTGVVRSTNRSFATKATTTSSRYNKNKKSSNTCITDFLTSPTKVAQTFDWNRSNSNILNMLVSKEQIELAVSSHPSYGDETTEELEILHPLPFETTITTSSVKNDNTDDRNKNKKNRKQQSVALSSHVLEEFQDILYEYRICGVVVSWPVTTRGRCGAPCGRVLFCLDQMIAPVLSGCGGGGDKQRMRQQRSPPAICLYDPHHYLPDEDEWGRSKHYGYPPGPDKTLYRRSVEDNVHCHDLTCQSIWTNFRQEQWPQFALMDDNNNDEYEQDEERPARAEPTNRHFRPSRGGRPRPRTTPPLPTLTSMRSATSSSSSCWSPASSSSPLSPPVNFRRRSTNNNTLGLVQAAGSNAPPLYKPSIDPFQIEKVASAGETSSSSDVAPTATISLAT